MANTKSAEKRNRQNETRRVRNTTARSQLKTTIKKAREAIAKNDATAKPAVVAAAAALGKAASRKVLHKRTASRRISRLAKAAAKAAKAPAAAPAKA